MTISSIFCNIAKLIYNDATVTKEVEVTKTGKRNYCLLAS